MEQVQSATARHAAKSPYHRMPIAEKRELAISRIRSPSVTCPQCDVQVMPDDLLPHLKDRCPGRRDPVLGDKWVTWREALALGVPRVTLSRWTTPDSRGVVAVRSRGDVQSRQYLLRDLALKISRRLGFHRR